jgi:hypothetical protein
VQPSFLNQPKVKKNSRFLVDGGPKKRSPISKNSS